MTELTCDICRDLIPLVVDGVASEESEAAVKEHVAACAECRDLYQKELERGIASLREKTADEKVLRRVRIRLAWQGMLLTFAALATISISARTVFLMWALPAVGAAAYVLMRRYSLAVPVLAGAAVLVWDRSLLSGVVMGGLLCMGIVIAALLIFAFGKEKQHDL